MPWSWQKASHINDPPWIITIPQKTQEGGHKADNLSPERFRVYDDQCEHEGSWIERLVAEALA